MDDFNGYSLVHLKKEILEERLLSEINRLSKQINSLLSKGM